MAEIQYTGKIKIFHLDYPGFFAHLDRNLLRDMGFDVTTVDYPSFHRATQNGPLPSEILTAELILVNAQLQELEGLFHLFRHNPELAHKPLVLLGVALPAQQQKHLQSILSYHYIEQPIPQKKLIEKLKKILNVPTRSSERLEKPEILTAHLTLEIGPEPRKKHPIIIQDLSKSGFGFYMKHKIMIEGFTLGTRGQLHLNLDGYRGSGCIQGSIIRLLRDEQGFLHCGFKNEAIDDPHFKIALDELIEDWKLLQTDNSYF